MGNYVDLTTNITTQVNNNILQNMKSTCNSDCGQGISGSTFNFINNQGDIFVTQSCVTDAACAMTSVAQAAANSVIKNMATQEAKAVTDFFGDFSINVFDETVDINTVVTNNITQISSQSCSATSNQTFDNNVTNVIDSTGGYYLTQAGSDNATCTMNNSLKIAAYNEVTNTSTQGVTVIGTFAMILIVVVVILLIGGLVVILMMIRGRSSQAAMAPTLSPLDVNAILDPNSKYSKYSKLVK